MRVALFGESGFVGQEVARTLRQNDIAYFGVSRRHVSEGSFQTDITDFSSLLLITQKADVAIICSSVLPKRSYQDDDLALYVNVNITGVHNILRWSALRGISRVIYCSTLSIVPHATLGHGDDLIEIGSHYMYKITKAAGEHLVMGFCREHKIEYYSMRIGSVYGPGMEKDLIELIREKIRKGERFVIQNNATTVDYVHVTDVAKAIVASAFDKRTNEIINVASGKRVKLRDLALTIGHILGKSLDIEIQCDEDLAMYDYSIDRMKGLIGAEPVPLEKGLRELFEWRQS